MEIPSTLRLKLVVAPIVVAFKLAIDRNPPFIFLIRELIARSPLFIVLTPVRAAPAIVVRLRRDPRPRLALMTLCRSVLHRLRATPLLVSRRPVRLVVAPKAASPLPAVLTVLPSTCCPRAIVLAPEGLNPRSPPILPSLVRAAPTDPPMFLSVPDNPAALLLTLMATFVTSDVTWKIILLGVQAKIYLYKVNRLRETRHLQVSNLRAIPHAGPKTHNLTADTSWKKSHIQTEEPHLTEACLTSEHNTDTVDT